MIRTPSTGRLDRWGNRTDNQLRSSPKTSGAGALAETTALSGRPEQVDSFD